jgi:hypothetical protein
MPLRMSVRPTAGHTRTPLGTGIIVALAPRRQPPPKRATPKPGSARALPANSISIAGTGGYGDAIASPRIASPLSEPVGRGSKIPPPAIDQTRRHVGLSRHVSHHCTWPERRRCNRLLLLAAPPGTSQDRPEPRRLPSHRLLQWYKHRCLYHCAIRPHQTER